ncbi:MAG: TlpA family protein disulfide reductase [Terriglobia bacterium]
MGIVKSKRICVFTIILLVTSSSILAGDPLPKLKLKDLNGHRQNLNEYRGKIIVLNVWATWCEPCQAEMPMLVQEEARYRDRGLVVIGVSLDKPGDEDKVRAFAAKYKAGFPIWLGGSADDLDRWKLGPAVPATAFIDRDGEIVGRVMGEMRRPSLEHRLEWLLGNKQAKLRIPSKII